MPASRRDFLAAGTLAAATAAALAPRARAADAPPAAAASPTKDPFIYCLNTSTIMGQKLTLPQQIDVAAKVGFTAMEPWLRDIHAHAKTGDGALKDIAKKLKDNNITVEDAIGFARWIVDDDAARAKGLEEAKRDMDVVAQIGGTRIAAPASGATDKSLELAKVAERYRALCELGDQMGVVPMVEVWGPSMTLTRLSDAVYVAIASGHRKACVLPDVYHLYKGNSDIAGLRLLSRECVPVIHFNDYPEMARADIKDEHRVMPGEGVAPITQILKDLKAMGGQTVLSLELFNRQYWKIDATVCAQTGIDKMKAAVAKAMA
jgi:2-keto-myo-inositol isomerase